MNNATGQKTPLSRAASTMHYRLDDDGDVLAARPSPLVEVRPLSGVQRHTVEQIIETFMPVQVLDAPVPQMGTQVVESMQKIDAQSLVEQVIEVPKLSQDRIPQRSAVRRPQKAEQLVEVPTVLSFSSLQQQTAEQIIDIPVLHRRRPGQGGLQSFSSGQNSRARFVEQNVDIPVPGGGLHVLPDLGGSSSSAVSRDERGEMVFRTVPQVKKSPKSASPSPRVPARSVSWTPAAYAAGQAADEYDEYFEYNGALFKQAWEYQHQCYCWCEVRREDGHCFMPLYVPPWERSQ